MKKIFLVIVAVMIAVMIAGSAWAGSNPWKKPVGPVETLTVTGDLTVGTTTRIAGTASEGQVQSASTNIASFGGETHYTDLTGTIRAGLHNATYVDTDLTKGVFGLYTYAESTASGQTGNVLGEVLGARNNAAMTGDGTLYKLTGSFNMAEIYGNHQGTPIVSNGRSIVGQLLYSSSDYNATMTDYRGLYLYSQKIDVGNTLSGTNWYQMYVSDFVDFGGTTIILYGLFMENIGTADAPTTNRMGIVLDGNGAGSDIVFGENQQISVGRNASSGYLDVKGNGIDTWSNTLRIGSDTSLNTRTDGESKAAYLVAPHKTEGEEDIIIVGQSQTAAHNIMNFGGGNTGLNSATKMRFYTSATNNVLTGTQRFMITEVGNFMFGPTTDLIGTNAVNVLGIQNGTAPSTSIANGVQTWSGDINAVDGQASLLMRNEAYAGTQIVPGVIYKATTDDPAGYEGAFEINTFDNVAKFYAEGAWRTVVTTDFAGTGNVGIGVTTPTAALHLKAGTATASTAPLKFTSGTLLATPEAGAVEFDGTSLYFSNSAGTRNTIKTTDFTNWTAYTPVVTSESGTWTNYTATGQYRISDRMLTVFFRILFSGSSSAASQMYVSLPSGLTMNSSVMTGGAGWDTDQVGFGVLGDNGVVSGVPAMIYTRTTQKVLLKYYAANAPSHLTTTAFTDIAPWIWANQDTIDGQFTVPIQ